MCVPVCAHTHMYERKHLHAQCGNNASHSISELSVPIELILWCMKALCMACLEAIKCGSKILILYIP